MARQVVRTSNAPQPAGPYSQGIKVGNLLFVSGQAPLDPGTGKMAGNDIESQTRQVLRNVKAIVEASGFNLSDVVKLSVFLRNADDFRKMNEVYKTFFPEDPPTRTTVEARLPGADMLIMIDAVAYAD